MSRLAVLMAAAALGPQAPPSEMTPGFVSGLISAALAQTTRHVVYDGSYRRLAYPGGDVPSDVGVCTDVVIRAYRAVGVDLQQRVHEDMTRAFAAYPRLWGLARPDANIDHRRVPNLQTFFRRRGADRVASSDPGGYQPGDLVSWMLPGNLPHIGLVMDRRSADGARPLIVHNIGNGPQLEDMLFAFPVTGHYRYRGE
jgi:uncharacterized protein YijF (DUF1287 family)